MSFQGFMGIHLLAKKVQNSFNKRKCCHELLVWMQIRRVLFLRHAVYVYYKESLSYYFEVCVSDMAMLFNCRDL